MTFYWKPETKLDKMDIFLEENLKFQNLTFFGLNLIWPWVKCENEYHHRFLRPKSPIKYVSHRTRDLFSSVDFILPSLDNDCA